MNMNFETIPKKIHYCWFGGSEKPDLIKECIDSWYKILDDYEIIEWNENNFDINSNKYMKQAYENKKFAFVSDYVRVKVLYEYGGIYLDTDVEVFKKFDNLLKHESIWGFEEQNYIATSTIGAKKGNKIIKEFLDLYTDINFIGEDGVLEMTTNVAMVTDLLSKKGIKLDGNYQSIDSMTIFPRDYFSPYDYSNCRNFKTENTYCVHHFYKSWMSIGQRIKSNIKYILAKVIGGDNIAKLREYIK